LSSANHSVVSVIRDTSQSQDIKDVGAEPVVLSLEDSPASDFTNLFNGKDVVVFSAGAGGKGGEERTKKVDYEGALKIFDAIEGVQGKKPRLLLVSGIDVRDPEKIPSHYVRHDQSIHSVFRVYAR
jgi:nucleoside-diphosphate-sugar epimerase